MATLALTPVEDPSAYGLVRTADGGEVTEFVEKPSPDQVDTRNISAGAYVLERAVLDMLEPEQAASIERDVFPQLVGNGLYGCVAEGYWLDIGTPARYLQGTYDILEGTVGTNVAERMGQGYLCVEHGVENARADHPLRAGGDRLPDRRRRADRRARGAGDRRQRGRQHDDRARGRDAGRRDRRRTARCAAASWPAGWWSATTA